MLPLDHSGPCPICGDTRKTHDVHIEGTLRFEGLLRWKHVREYYEKHPVPLGRRNFGYGRDTVSRACTRRMDRRGYRIIDRRYSVGGRISCSYQGARNS